MYIHTFIHTYIRRYVCIYIHTHTHTYVCMYIYIHCFYTGAAFYGLCQRKRRGRAGVFIIYYFIHSFFIVSTQAQVFAAYAQEKGAVGQEDQEGGNGVGKGGIGKMASAVWSLMAEGRGKYDLVHR